MSLLVFAVGRCISTVWHDRIPDWIDPRAKFPSDAIMVGHARRLTLVAGDTPIKALLLADRYVDWLWTQGIRGEVE